jgi:hypothetical protein
VRNAAVALFAWSMALFYLPGQGFTYLIQFGEKLHGRYLPEVKAVNHYEMRIRRATTPSGTPDRDPSPPEGSRLRKAVDSLPYRARRILFLWTAWLLGGGDPARVMNAYTRSRTLSAGSSSPPSCCGGFRP